MKNNRYGIFTLIEVVVALAILSMGILASMSLLAASRERTFKAAKQWKEQHIICQAVEYFMLAGIDGGIPEEFFPYKDYSITGEYVPAENLPDEISNRMTGWQLMTMIVTLHDSTGTVVRKMSIDRLVKDSEL